MNVVWDIKKAAANILNHGIFENTLCPMRLALCDYLPGAEDL